MLHCIYCRGEKPEGDFNQEHALPQAFGSFENNPTLHCVCTVCNKQLGDELISPFMRESIEGLMRYGVGHKSFSIDEPPEHLSQRLNSQHFKVTISLPPELTNMKWEFMGFSQVWKGFIRFPVQIGLWPKTLQLPAFFSDVDLQTNPDLTSFLCDEEHPALIYAEGRRNRDLLLGAVAALCFPVPCTRDVTPGPNLEGELTFRLDKRGARLITYVAFNYLAYELGAGFVLDENFDSVRQFIRYGDGIGKDFVDKDNHAILWDETISRKHMSAHQIVLDWDCGTHDIIARLSLYGTMFYRVHLSRGYKGLFRPDLQRGRAFDWKEHHTYELRPATGLIFPKPWS